MRSDDIDEPSRPKGIGVSALIISALVLIAFFSTLVQLSGNALGVANLLQLLSAVFLIAVASFSIWSYWKGKAWARILVLIASFLIAVREVSRMIDDGATLASLMSHPTLFFDFVMALFLLYWLNTRSVRAWFRNASSTAADLIGAHLEGKLCATVIGNGGAPAQEWHLVFEHDAELTLNCPWRIVLDDNLAFASSASEGSATAMSAEEDQPRQLLQNLRVKSVRVTPRTSDLFVAFEMGIELQTWNSDLGSQQWKFSDPLLTVTADSAGLKSKANAEIPTEDFRGND